MLETYCREYLDIDHFWKGLKMWERMFDVHVRCAAKLLTIFGLRIDLGFSMYIMLGNRILVFLARSIGIFQNSEILRNFLYLFQV